MWRTFPGTPIGPFGISCMVVVCVGLRTAVLQRSKASMPRSFASSGRGSDQRRSAYSRRPLILCSGLDADHIESAQETRRSEVTQVLPHAGAVWLDRTEHIGGGKAIQEPSQVKTLSPASTVASGGYNLPAILRSPEFNLTQRAGTPRTSLRTTPPLTSLSNTTSGSPVGFAYPAWGYVS